MNEITADVQGGLGDFIRSCYTVPLFRKTDILGQLGYTVKVRHWSGTTLADPTMFTRLPGRVVVEPFGQLALSEQSDWFGQLRECGLQWADLPDNEIAFRLTEEEKRGRDKLVADALTDTGKPVVLVHPFLSDEVKCFAGPRWWADMVGLLAEDATVLVVGHPTDPHHSVHNAAVWAQLHWVAAGRLVLNDLPWFVMEPFFRTAAFALCNESSVQHMCYAFGTPSIVLAAEKRRRGGILGTDSAWHTGAHVGFHWGCLADPLRHVRLIHSAPPDPFLVLNLARDVARNAGRGKQ